MEKKASFWKKLGEIISIHTIWHFTGDRLLDMVMEYPKGATVNLMIAVLSSWFLRLLRPIAWPFLAATGFVIFVATMYVWEFAQKRQLMQAATTRDVVDRFEAQSFVELSTIAFDYLPDESPLA
jgi:hypothetical protein